MITAPSGRFLHPDSLQPSTSSASLSHIELDASKSPLALLAQTCLQIGKSDPFSSTDSPNKSKDSGCLKIRNISVYSKSMEKKDSESSTDGPCVLRTRSATCRPFARCSPKIQDEDEKIDRSSLETFEMIRSEISELYGQTKRDSVRNPSWSAPFSTSSSLGLSIPPFSALPLPPIPSSCVSFPQPALPTLHNKPGMSVISTVPCGDPYCLGYHCAARLKSTFPLLYSSHSLPFSSMSAITIFPPGLMHPHDLQSSVFNRVSANFPENNLSSSGSHTPTLRNSHHTLAPGARFHPYFNTTFPTTSNSYYSLHGLSFYGQRLHLAP